MLSKERKLEIYTERLWRFAMDLAMQASMGGKERHGIAVVAEETHSISNQLYRLLENEDNEVIRASVCDALGQLQALALNGVLEMLRVFESFSPDRHITNPTAVILEEIRHTAGDISNLFGFSNAEADLPHPELKQESRVSDAKLFLVQATVGGIPFVENAAYVQEIFAYIDGDEYFGIQEGHLNLRCQKIPVIDCYARFNLERPDVIDSTGRRCAMLINTEWEKQPAKYAVLVDALPLAFGFYSRFSEGKDVESRSAIFANQYVRACWDTVDNGQMLFIDWKTLA